MEKVRFEVVIKRDALERIMWFFQRNDVPLESEEEAIRELFLVNSLREEVDERENVEVRRLRR